MFKMEENSNNKTCGECRYFEVDAVAATCEKRLCICDDDTPACKKFEQKPLTNGDIIQQGGNRAIAKFAYKTARTHICGTCAFATIENGRYVCTAKDGQSCVDGIEAWLNAPADCVGKDTDVLTKESEGNDEP
jgi:ABC-type sulfate transport system substrate-binding protein